MKLNWSKKQLIIVIGCVLFVYAAKAQEVGKMVDTRDGQTYQTVTYSVQSIEFPFTDHDEYGTYVNGSPQVFEVSFEKSSPSTLTWMQENLNYEVPKSKCKYESDADCEQYGRLYTWEASKDICPNEWHLPSDEEWFVLASLYGGVVEAGQHLKSTKLNGTDQSQFSVKKPSIFWSSSELDEESALDWKVNYRWDKLQRWKGGKNLYNSVRCVKDY